MMNPTRNSPLAAFFTGIWVIGAVSIASVACIVLYGMKIVDGKTASILGIVENTLDSLPELVESLPPALGELLNDRRSPEYAANIETSVEFSNADEEQRVRPVLTVKNKGKDVVSMLAVRVVALDSNRTPMREWTEVVATPVAIKDEWRGPIMPGQTRRVILSRTRVQAGLAGHLTGEVEVSDIRLWQRPVTGGPATNNG